MKALYKNYMLLFTVLIFQHLQLSAAIPIEQFPICQNEIKIENSKVDENHLDQKKAKRRSKSLNGILSMSFGIASLIIFPLFSIPALILGGLSITYKEPQAGYRIAGLITGGIGLFYLLLLIVLLIVGVF